jgi:hypothetical protein
MNSDMHYKYNCWTKEAQGGITWYIGEHRKAGRKVADIANRDHLVILSTPQTNKVNCEDCRKVMSCFGKPAVGKQGDCILLVKCYDDKFSWHIELCLPDLFTSFHQRKLLIRMHCKTERSITVRFQHVSPLFVTEQRVPPGGFTKYHCLLTCLVRDDRVPLHELGSSFWDMKLYETVLNYPLLITWADTIISETI